MNNIFKVIWNHATQTWTAVGELASAKGKSKSVKLAAISTALLVVTGGAQTAFASSTDIAKTTSVDAGSSAANTATIQYDASMQGGLAISPDRVTDQFKGDAHNGTANIPGATVYAYDGIAIGSGTVAGTKEVGGNGHVAIGLMARANGAKTGGAAVALGAYAVAEEQDTVAIGNKAYANGSQAVSIGHQSKSSSNGTVAVGNKSESTGFNSTAVGDGSQALSKNSTALGSKSVAKKWDSTAVGNKASVEGDNSTSVGASSNVTGNNISSLGKGSTISSNNVSALGANITVEKGRDGAVVLGYGSDAGKETTKVMAVNSAVAEGSPLVYSGFSGKLGGTDTNGTNKEATGKQGNVVSVGSEGNERQIKHVAAGQITAESTDAINGSQLYQVAKTLGTAANQTANALGVTLNPNGTLSGFSQPLTIAEGSDYNKDENGNDKAPITATNVGDAIKNLNSYVNAGWKVATPSTSEDKGTVSIGHTVNFVGVGNVDVDGEFDNKNGTHNINISVDSPLDYASTKAEVEVGGKKVDVDVVKANDGKWYPKDQVDENNNPKDDAESIPSSEIVKKGAKLTDSDTENNPYEKGNSYTYDENGNITATGYDNTKPESKDKITAGKNGVQLNNVGWATQPDQAVNKDQLDQTVNKSGFYVQQNGKSTLDAKTGSDKVSDTEKVTPNDVVNFADGDGTRVRAITKRDETTGVDKTTFYVDVYEPTKPNSLPAVYTDENGNKLQPGGNGYYPADAVKINDKWYPAGTTEDNVAKAKELTPVSNVIISMNNPNSLANTAGDPVAVTNVGKGTKNYDDQTAGEKSPAYKDAINGLANLEGSKDSNVLTVADAKNFGWVVSTSDNQKATAVKNADVVDFKAEEGTGITVEGKLDDTNTKMTVTVGNKHFKTNTKNTVPAAKATGENSVAIGGNSNAAAKDAIAIGNGAEVAPTATQGSVAIGAGAKAGKANVGSYSIDPSATVAGKTGPDTRVVSVGDKGNEAQIQNVAPGVISETSTDAVNGSQLHSVIKNLNNSNDYLDRKVNKHSKQARAGIAGANAAAALPQAYTQGRAMVAAAAGTFKGQNALAVGYSRISDNGKVILKLQGNANTSGDVGAGVGVGYQW
ncbi:MAG: YadA-like family protein [Haemophilus parainfluenzae]|nr:YadA-like family protein [Haemophilus parainfluenzae]MDU5724551.1 YadA-like family protein [Haemophilus parainfluenzae]MDU5747766.1 YadA-like family protein [Haemophilus parainfluenzae]MDU5777893.1 YadA-like family protein [Haemophilus parainfluenzae]